MCWKKEGVGSREKGTALKKKKKGLFQGGKLVLLGRKKPKKGDFLGRKKRDVALSLAFKQREIPSWWGVCSRTD